MSAEEMPAESDRHDSTREAIAVMTAWADGADGVVFSAEQIMRIAEEDDDGISTLVSGLVNLAGILLVEHQQVTGREPARTLQAVAAKLSEL
ncbi:hypothetical protein QMK17_04000 [Rhodococcus sp. G-MC3]|uniref:hypothetical protein n=1 Tax=Rhodococcus sp. G-MC3 TaxID=3046209 RepID=UPI0024BAE4B4|nr:hypothetical protein [Rhodococcus sp. G-MC3]MDJ0392496.1 hypothetical protein [Rhodococcus sp. G-MC3]